MEEKLNEILKLIKDGKISIREASRQSGYSRDYLKQRLIETYGTNDEELKKIEELMSDNKANSTAKAIDPKLMETVFLRTMNGEISLTKAREELGGIDIETLKGNFLQFIKNNENNENLLLKYRNYANSTQTDITQLNFRVLAIEMIHNRMSQTELAEKIRVSPRTVSREFEKFKNDKDQSLYTILKFYSDKVMRKKKITRYEETIMTFALNSYEQRHPELLSTDIKSKSEEKLEKVQLMVAEEERLRKEGFTQAEIAKKLGTSVSGLRRARIFIEEQRILNGTVDISQDKKDKKDAQEPKDEPNR